MFAKPRPASTIAVIRDAHAEAGIEVLLMKRGAEDRFLPSYFVFPGGAVDKQDRVCGCSCAPSLYRSVQDERSRDELFTHINAAIRETFEESGILFAYDAAGKIAQTSLPGVHMKFNAYRNSVTGRSMTFDSVLREEKLTPAYDCLHYLSRWITPVYSPIRYDARFFVAIVPPDQHISHDGDELVESIWMNPGEALICHKKGKMKMVTPTTSSLEFLADYRSTGLLVDYFIAKEKASPLKAF